MSTRPRGQLGDGAVLSVSAAVAELGLREADGIAWLRDRGLVRTIRLPSGRTVERVSWRRVLDVLEAGESSAATSPPTAWHEPLRRARTL